MIVSPRRLILAIILAPPVIKIKQRLLCLTTLYADKKLSAYTLHADKKLSAYTLCADKANLKKMAIFGILFAMFGLY